ncbi:MAG TPA: hypothetical protein VKA44_05875 [Gemmatimonadota bacterium]|nr:hypothetical protein [Gemmatimonadota bacterium]
MSPDDASRPGRAADLLTSLVALAAAGVPPNLFWIAQAGYAKLSQLAIAALIPSVIVLVAVAVQAALRGQRRLLNRLLAGGAAGLVATAGLEAVRIAGFHLGWMPGSMPKLLGVLLLDRFMLGPSALSNVLGWAYHAWNGVCFGIVFTVLLGRKPLGWALAFGELVGVGFLVSPAVRALGVGFFALDMPLMIVTVLVAHLAFGLLLGLLSRRWIRDSGWLLAPLWRG